MIASMIASVLVVGAASVAYKNYNVNHDSVRIARIRNLMNVVEVQLRRRALQPEAYNCPVNSSVSNCTLNPTLFDDIRDQQVTGAKGSDGKICPSCGVHVDVYLGASVRQFRGVISYNGADARIKPIDFTMTIPTEVMQSPVIRCGTINNGLTPIFAGFNADGSPNCQGFANNTCPAGTFLKYVNVSGRAVQCEPLPPPVSCNSDQKFVTFNWVGGNIQYSCNDLQDPPFTSYSRTRTPATVPAPDRSVTPPIEQRNDVITATVPYVRTETYTEIASPSPVPTTQPPPSPVCSTQEVQLGMGNGATPRVFGGYACLASCHGTFGPQSRCGGPCASGYRGWYFCYDCREDRVVCN
jgi:hypothetical protein